MKEEVKDLRANIKIKQEQPNKADFEASKMTEIMLKEKRDMEQHVEDIKKSCATAIELKNIEIKTLVDENNDQKKEIKEIKAKISKLTSNQIEQIGMDNSTAEIISAKKDEKNVLKDGFACDKCSFSTTNLSILVNHKANEHKPIMKCDQCKFKAIKKSDLEFHLLLKHGGLTLKNSVA